MSLSGAVPPPARGPRLSGQERERPGRGANHGEVLSIERRDFADAESLGGGHDRRIRRSEWELPILRNGFCDPQPITSDNRLSVQISLCEIREETDLSFDSQTGFQQVRHFGNDQHRYHQRSGMRLEKIEARPGRAVARTFPNGSSPSMSSAYRGPG